MGNFNNHSESVSHYTPALPVLLERDFIISLGVTSVTTQLTRTLLLATLNHAFVHILLVFISVPFIQCSFHTVYYSFRTTEHGIGPLMLSKWPGTRQVVRRTSWYTKENY